MRKVILNHKLVWALALWASFISLPPSGAWAMPSESLGMSQNAAVREAQITQIMQVMSTPVARLHLQMAGFKQADLRETLAKLDDAQLAQVSSKAESVKAGGDALGLIVVLLVITLLVVLILKLSDKKIVIHDQK